MHASIEARPPKQPPPPPHHLCLFMCKCACKYTIMHIENAILHTILRKRSEMYA